MPKDIEEIHERWERALERRGAKSVRLLLHAMSGGDVELALRSLVSEPPYPPLSFVESWLAREGSSSGKVARRVLWPVLLLILAIGLIVAAISTGDLELPKIGWF